MEMNKDSVISRIIRNPLILFQLFSKDKTDLDLPKTSCGYFFSGVLSGVFQLITLNFVVHFLLTFILINVEVWLGFDVEDVMPYLTDQLAIGVQANDVIDTALYTIPVFLGVLFGLVSPFLYCIHLGYKLGCWFILETTVCKHLKRVYTEVKDSKVGDYLGLLFESFKCLLRNAKKVYTKVLSKCCKEITYK